MLSPELETEVAALARRFGQPRRAAVELSGAPFDPLFRTDRFGEVCMVLRRRSGRLLTAIKTFYPPNAFRLLTGGIGHGEAIEHALLREVDEETGLQVAIRRFLAVIEYRLDSETQIADIRGRDLQVNSVATNSQLSTPDPYTFVTFAFLLDELSGTLETRDPDERVAAFREIDVAELPAVADTLAHVADQFDHEIGGSWADWGRFRATAHRVIYRALLPKPE